MKVPAARMGASVFVALLALLALLAACAPPAPVVQGKVTSVEEQGKVILVADERRPDAPPLALDIASAEIGNAPVVGDDVRVVYRTEGGVNRALRVMNLTRQREVEKSGH
ncbi:MAG: hypothetical protein ACP5VN_05760 [Acidobacteriota bacterium]